MRETAEFASAPPGDHPPGSAWWCDAVLERNKKNYISEHPRPIPSARAHASYLFFAFTLPLLAKTDDPRPAAAAAFDWAPCVHRAFFLSGDRAP